MYLCALPAENSLRMRCRLISVVIDLYLGCPTSQKLICGFPSMEWLRSSRRRLRRRPPVIILMSRSGRLMEQADSFRDSAKGVCVWVSDHCKG